MFVLFLLGPTASGKSNLALSLSEEFSGEIINIDSVQLYQGLDVGSAKPTKADFNRVAHHLFDVCKKGDDLTAGDFEKMAMSKLSELHERGLKFCVCVGGSGFYFRALRYGMFEAPKLEGTQKKSFDEEMTQYNDHELHDRLRRVDPEKAMSLEPNDRYRVLRALEIIKATGKMASEVERDFEPRAFPYPHLVVGLQREREGLIRDIRTRAEHMLHNGWIEEVQGLFNEGLDDWKPLGSVGYREICSHLKGEMGDDSLLDEIVKSTRRLAKKQMTWFRKEKGIHWINVDEGFDSAFEKLKRLVQNSMREVSGK